MGDRLSDVPASRDTLRNLPDLHASHSLRSALNRTLEILDRQHQAIRSAVTLLHRDTGQLHTEATHGTSAAGQAARYRLGEGITGAGGPERQADCGAPGEPRAAVSEPLGAHRSRQARGVVHLRAHRAQPQDHRRARRRSALQEGSRVRRADEVPARAGGHDRAGRARRTARGRRAPAPARREHPSARRAPGPLRLLPHRRHERPHAAGLRADRAGGRHQHDGAHPRRVGHRQGAHRARHSLQLAARAEALHQGQLRRPARLAHRVGAVRLREGRLYRRAGAEEGALRAGRGRHAVSRRDRRHQPLHAGQAAARAAGARVRAARRHRAGQDERAHDRRHEQGPGEGHRGRRRSARISITASTCS